MVRTLLFGQDNENVSWNKLVNAKAIPAANVNFHKPMFYESPGFLDYRTLISELPVNK